MFFRKKKAKQIKVGDVVPDFELPRQDGKTVRLSDFRGKNWVILYFYPKDDTYGCIAESCDFRDQYPVFRSENAEVIGISSDSPQSHAQFAAKYNLPFQLLSDPDSRVRDAYGVKPTLSVIPGRVTFVIDASGIVRHIFNSQFNPKSHVVEALAALPKAESAR